MIGVIAVIGFASLHQELQLERVYLLAKNCKEKKLSLCQLNFVHFWRNVGQKFHLQDKDTIKI